MAKDTGLTSYQPDDKTQDKLISECVDHESTSYRFFENVRKDWDAKEALLFGARPEDQLSKTTKAKISNPILGNQLIERSGRVMAQPATGQAHAVSKDDVGKNILMNLLIKYFQDNANEEGSHLLKFRQLDVYSGVYGSMFGLVPWRVNRMNGYIGPELLPLSMRSVRPQPGRRTIDKMDWFTVESNVSIHWLEMQDPGVWLQDNVARLKQDLMNRKDGGDSAKNVNDDHKSYIERKLYPNANTGDKRFPDIKLFTEYRNDMWISWTPQIVDSETSRPYVLRVVKNPYIKGYLPIVVKHSFPLIDSIIGLGDFERGRSLQYALNSLINLYMDGVKYAIFPPLHINLDQVDPASIRWGAGEKWYMERPNESVQIMNMQSTQWLSTFTSTYGFLQSALQNLGGSTSVASVEGSNPELGKTPDAIKQYGLTQSARDDWDRFMMEDCIKQVYDRWICLTTEKLDIPITMRIFGAEIKDLQKTYPEEGILDVFKSGERGNLSVDKTLLNDDIFDPETGEKLPDKDYTKYDFDVEPGSTMKPAMVDEGEAASQTIKDFQDAPWLLQEVRAKGKDVDFAELLKRRMIGQGVKDWDKIVIDLDPAKTPEGMATAQQGMNPGGPTPEDASNNGQIIDAEGNIVNPEAAANLESGALTPEALIEQALANGDVLPGEEAAPEIGAPIEEPAPQPNGDIQDPAIAEMLSKTIPA